MQLNQNQWNIEHLREHLQYAVDLEFWTIPFYMSAMYSLVDRTSDAFQLIQSVVNQEMLHLQLAGNVANAYGYSPKFPAPVYEGETIPHLDFSLDKHDPRTQFSPFSAEIGPLDQQRINAMCLVEYPKWDTDSHTSLNEDTSEYGSIGEFYEAVKYGASLLKQDLHGGIKQIDYFTAFYRNMPLPQVTSSGEEGFNQAIMLMDVITDQGEGCNRKDDNIARAFQNTADDSYPELAHYDKFLKIRDACSLPETYPVKAPADYTAEDQQVLDNLIKHFTEFRAVLEALFNGQNPQAFVKTMMTVGADIQLCWKHGVTPKFS